MYRSKRPHNKSRRGCQGCRGRRIKCDEVKPSCTFCSSRGLECLYPSEIASQIQSRPLQESSYSAPQPYIIEKLPSRDFTLEIPGSIGFFNEINMKQMRLMHHYTTATYATLNVLEEYRDMRTTWQIELPRIAFEHDFLMAALLAFASLHLQYLKPEDKDLPHQTALYQHQALKNLRRALSNRSTNENVAVLATSMLLIPLAMGQIHQHPGTDLWTSHFLGLSMGVRSVIDSLSRQLVMKSELGPILDFSKVYQPSPVVQVLPESLVGMLESIAIEELAAANVESYRHMLILLGTLYGYLAKYGSVSPELEIETRIWAAQASSTFNMLVRSLDPPALVIIAHFMIFFQVICDNWWTIDVARKEIPTINSYLPPEWRSVIQVPLLATELDDREAIIELLLNQGLMKFAADSWLYECDDTDLG